MEQPRLIENGISNFMYDTLKSCHTNRVKLYSIALNVGVLIIFICIVCITLYYCYRKKPSEIEIRAKMLRDQEYVLSKIRFYQAESQNIQQTPLKNTNNALRTLLS
jgi:hypothetical protein